MIPVADSLAVDIKDAQALKAQANNGDRAALLGAARQFEAMLVTQMLKTMRATHFSAEDDPLNSGEGMKLYQDLLDQQWATQLSKGRGLGFADMMVKALQRMPGADQANTAQGADAAKLAAPQAAGKHIVAPVIAPAYIPAAASEPPPAAEPAEQPTQRQGSQTTQSAADAKQAFLETMRPYAVAAASATGVPAEFILAHAALESGWGRHEIKTANGQTSHNLFGIKAGQTWDGAVAETVTTEFRQGVAMKLTQRFRAYSDYGSAFSDYAQLLASRYSGALQAGADAVTFAKGLSSGGYATDPAYADKLKAVIATVAEMEG